MKHHTQQETDLGREEERFSEEEDIAFDLQCPDSLSIAANHIGEDVFGVRKLLLRGYWHLRRSRGGLVNTAQGPSPARSQYLA
jgi:hypothetical protein